MALPLCHLRPSFISSIYQRQHQKNNSTIVLHSRRRSTRFTSKFELFSTPVYSSNRRRLGYISLPNSAIVDGVQIESNPGDSSAEAFRDSRVEALVEEKLRNWFEYLRTFLPGGRWWEFSEEVEIEPTAKPVTVLRALHRMWGLVARDRWVIYIAFASLIVTALSEISIPHFLTASIFSAQSGKVSVFQGNVRILVIVCLTAGICSGIRGCCFGIANMILVKRMRETLYSSLLSQDISFFDGETVGDLTSRLGADCQQVSRVIGNDLNFMLRNGLQGAGALIYLLILSWPLGLCTLAICSTLATIMLVYGQYQKKAAKLTQEITASANEVAQETFSLMRTVRVYGTEKREINRYVMWLGKLADVSLRQSAAFGFWNLSFNMLYHSTQVIAVLVGGMFILQGKTTAEQLTKYIMYSEWLIFSTWWVGDSFSNLMQSVGASEKVFQLMDLSQSGQFRPQGLKLTGLIGRINFVDVSFHYSSRPTASVLRHLSITMNPSEVVAIVGLSGSGKSTLVNLLLRLYEPTSGQILIDGHPLKDLDIKWFRERIGYVGQEPRLFRMDVGSNIRYGCPREVKQEDVEWAAKQAYAHNFIVSLPNGYETIVDDDLLSGGQKQRIAIARAILRDPTILILDEATSALDAESEHYVKGVLRALRSDTQTKRTVIVIAHRLSTIQAADKIVVMGSGEILEMGTHTELLANNGLYARLTRRQADSVE